MFKMIAATLAVLYVVLWVFGADERRVETVARAKSDVLDVSVTALVPAAKQIASVASKPEILLSEAEAVKLAIEGGEALRAAREQTTLIGARPSQVETASTELASAALENAPTEQENISTQSPLWYVTGSRVNLRAGPGTSHDVVGRLSLGAEANVLSERDGWYQIKSADGSVSGWILGKFLAEQRPG